MGNLADNCFRILHAHLQQLHEILDKLPPEHAASIRVEFGKMERIIMEFENLTDHEHAND